MDANSEIEQALKEFEAKSSAEQVQAVEETSKSSEASGMIGMVIKHSGGAIKDARQANYVLLAMALLFLLISGFLFLKG